MRKNVLRSLALVVLIVGFSACGENGSPTEPTAGPCSYSVSPSSLSFGASGGAGSVTVSAGAQCTWTASSDRGWMSITSGASGAGNGVVSVSLTPNTNTTERTGTLTIAGQSVAVREDGQASCTIDISPANASFGKDSATGTFAVSAADQCQWSAMSTTAWIAVTSGSPGTGNGTVGYSIERNRELIDRTGTITVGSRTFTITQAADTPPAPACEYSVTPAEFTPCMSASYTMTATITTQAGCTWTAEPDASWITLTAGQSKSGPGVVSFTVSDNWDAPRQSVVKVRWPTVTAGQNIRVLQAGCLYSVSTAAVNVSAAGGPGRFDVYQMAQPNTCGGATQDACRWTAQSDVPWITITTSMPQAGDNPVSFTVAANATTTARTGRITVRDKVVQITQAGQ
jgi:Viral BACON domain/Putative binding domain, N-terminal